MDKLTVKNRIYELEKIFELIQKIAREHEIADDITNDLYLCVDEVFSNIVRYAYEDDEEHEIYFSCKYDKPGKKISMLFSDCGREFNPLETNDPDFTIDLLEREPGGLGVFIVTSLMSEVEYKRFGKQNKLMIIKDIV